MLVGLNSSSDQLLNGTVAGDALDGPGAGAPGKQLAALQVQALGLALLAPKGASEEVSEDASSMAAVRGCQHSAPRRAGILAVALAQARRLHPSSSQGTKYPSVAPLVSSPHKFLEIPPADGGRVPLAEEADIVDLVNASSFGVNVTSAVFRTPQRDPLLNALAKADVRGASPTTPAQKDCSLASLTSKDPIIPGGTVAL
eukprot:CAMPEP_0172895002 /NCGR_PEP_ID=MMETSP1075-20121228/152106_1 /TAXON_ID=2916 /ORGANISM="Ceratium fusus, Strain PA161109" /LENGTH=199 /DNA_ID=CAMNT_0013750135 /DNA_START=560 /DNA_END=1162 /DNA_ORIENTATION=+